MSLSIIVSSRLIRVGSLCPRTGASSVRLGVSQRPHNSSRTLMTFLRALPEVTVTSTSNSITEDNRKPLYNDWYIPSPVISQKRNFSQQNRDRITSPVSTNIQEFKEEVMADHSWRQINHIWTDDEILHQMATKDIKKHTPVTPSDKLMNGIMRGLYWSFNTVTGYQHENPKPKSIEWRLIILESFAGVPGFLAAAFRHFYSLRTLKRDHGRIFTFLEEAENERMHLLVCLKMFKANAMTRGLVVAAQLSMTPFLMVTYMISPNAMHRFVGYLEETAVDTYANIVENCEKEGSHLHKAWSPLDAPSIAKKYWALEDDASWVTCLKHMLADEAHHRDVNHTFADLSEEAPSPFVKDHMQDFDRAVLRRTENILKGALTKKESDGDVTNGKKGIMM